MKHIKSLLFVLIIFLNFISCKKDEKADNITCQLTSILPNDMATMGISLKYDDQNKIVEYKEGDVKYNFKYTGLSGKLEMYLTDTDSLVGKSNLTFDANGRLTSYEDYRVFSGERYRYYYEFNYNNEGYLKSGTYSLTSSSSESIYKDTLIYTDGNLTKLLKKRIDGSIDVVVDYNYGSIANKLWNFYWNYYTEPFEILSGYRFFYPLLGKPSKNLPSKIIVTEGTSVNEFSYDYSVNSDGYVTEYNERQVNSVIGSRTNNFKLGYACK